MTARSSKGNFRNFGKYIRHKLRSMRSMIVLNCIFAVLSYPLFMTVLLPYANVSVEMNKLTAAGLYRTEAYSILNDRCNILEGLLVAAAVIGCVALAAMFLMNYVLCSKAFRWLYKKSIVDMDYSLPVSGDTRFFGDLLASLAGSLVPHILAIAIGSGLYWCLPFGALEADAGEPAAAFGILMQFVGTGLFACVMFTGICLLVMSLCGRAIEARIMPFVINVAIPAIHALCVVMLTSNMLGYSSAGNYEYIGLASTSPLGLLIMTFVTLDSSIYSDDFAGVRIALLRPAVLIPLLIITIGVFVAAYFLIRVRRAERVGSPYVFPVVKTAIPAIVTFAIVATFMAATLPELEYYYAGELSGVFVGMVVLTFIVYIIMELISGKGFKRFHITLGKYAATMVVCVLVCLGLYYTNGLGFARVVPDSSDVSSAYINLYTEEDFTDCDFNTYVYDAESLEAITEYHRALPKNDAYYDDYSSYHFRVEYTLRSGSTLSRYYNLSREQYMDAVKAMITPEVYYSDRFGDRYDYYLNDVESGDATCNIISVVFDNQHQEVNIPLTQLAEAYRKDCDSLTYSLLIGDTGVSKDFVSMQVRYDYSHESFSYSDSFSFTVYSWQKNVIKLLQSNGVRGLFADNTDKCATAFVVMIPTENGYVYGSGDLNAQSLLLASVADQLTDAQLEQYGYYYDKYGYYYDGIIYEYGYSYDGPTVTVEDAPVSAYYNIISSDWKLYSLPADDENAQKLNKLCSDIMPLDYSKVYSEKQYILALVFTDASYERMNAEGGISYNYEIIRFVIPENYDKAMEIINTLA